ncbi:hypothetical protein Thermo_01922 [Thermoplasmatales archaeon]|nr:hypothetical protein Thermo_01922 [Thermoplasmatales archaeon]
MEVDDVDEVFDSQLFMKGVFDDSASEMSRKYGLSFVVVPFATTESKITIKVFLPEQRIPEKNHDEVIAALKANGAELNNETWEINDIKHLDLLSQYTSMLKEVESIVFDPGLIENGVYIQPFRFISSQRKMISDILLSKADSGHANIDLYAEYLGKSNGFLSMLKMLHLRQSVYEIVVEVQHAESMGGILAYSDHSTNWKRESKLPHVNNVEDYVYAIYSGSKTPEIITDTTFIGATESKYISTIKNYKIYRAFFGDKLSSYISQLMMEEHLFYLRRWSEWSAGVLNIHFFSGELFIMRLTKIMREVKEKFPNIDFAVKEVKMVYTPQ